MLSKQLRGIAQSANKLNSVALRSAWTAKRYSHDDVSYDGFNQKYKTFFDNAPDLFEVQRGLNNCFSYDLVPSTEVIESALRASRRVNDFAVALRVFHGLRQKVENDSQYKAYRDELKPVCEELGIGTSGELDNI